VYLSATAAYVYGTDPLLVSNSITVTSLPMGEAVQETSISVSAVQSLLHKSTNTASSYLQCQWPTVIFTGSQ